MDPPLLSEPIWSALVKMIKDRDSPEPASTLPSLLPLPSSSILRTQQWLDSLPLSFSPTSSASSHTTEDEMEAEMEGHSRLGDQDSRSEAQPPRPPPSLSINNHELPTIFYSDYIRRLDARALDTKQYKYPRKAGSGVGDTTSFLRSQQYWGMDRTVRPYILFQLHRPQNYHYQEPGLLFIPFPCKEFPLLAVVVDDHTKIPLRDFPEVPIRISTDVEGWLLEAWMRLNPALRHDDIVARMPHVPVEERQGGNKFNNIKNRLTGRRRDFRHTGRCISWEKNTNHASAFDQSIFKEMGATAKMQLKEDTRDLEDLTLVQIQDLRRASERSRQPSSKRKQNEAMTSTETHSSPITSSGDYTTGPAARATQPLTGDSNNSTSQMQQWVGNDFQSHPAPAPTTTTIIPTHQFPPFPLHPTPTYVEMFPYARRGYRDLLSGQDLVNFLAAKGIQYNPQHLQQVQGRPWDQRFIHTACSEDRRQLLLGLHRDIYAVLRCCSSGRYEINLSTYADAYNTLQDNFVHACHLTGTDDALAHFQAQLSPRSSWTDAIQHWDVQDIPIAMFLDIPAREARKDRECPFLFTSEFVTKAYERLMINEHGKLDWPQKVVVEWRHHGIKIDRSVCNLIHLVDFE